VFELLTEEAKDTGSKREGGVLVSPPDGSPKEEEDRVALLSCCSVNGSIDMFPSVGLGILLRTVTFAD